MKDKTVTFSISVPESIRVRLDKLVDQGSTFSSRSHAFVRIFEEWEQTRKIKSPKSPQVYETIQ